MKVLKIIWYIIKLLAFFVLGILYFIVAAPLRLMSIGIAQKVFFRYLTIFLKGFGLNVHYKFYNDQSKRPHNSVFILLNQTSFLDSLLPPPVPKIRGIINIEFAIYPILGWFMAITNFVIIRQWPSQAIKTINRSNNFLRLGGNMYISIEGKRSKDGKINEYKKGAIVMAINSQSDIIPVIIEGTFDSLPYKSLYIKPGDISIKFLKPIITKGLTYGDRDELRDELKSIALQNGLKIR